MNHLKTRLKIFLVIFVGIMVIGTLGFMAIEDRSLIDAAYFVIVSMATVGYGDIHPVTQAGKVFTVALIIFGVGTFLGVIANLTEIMLAKREFENRMEKLNMVIGVFFSEVGITLLSAFARCDMDCDSIRNDLIVTAAWKEEDFTKARKDLARHDYAIAIDKLDMEELKSFFASKRGFLVGLLENPVLMEHQSFTDLLRAVFHFAEELSYRQAVVDLPQTDREHLAGDVKRAYIHLVGKWLDYLKYLKKNYPFLFSLAMRTNPLDLKASVVVK